MCALPTLDLMRPCLPQSHFLRWSTWRQHRISGGMGPPPPGPPSHLPALASLLLLQCNASSIPPPLLFQSSLSALGRGPSPLRPSSHCVCHMSTHPPHPHSARLAVPPLAGGCSVFAQAAGPPPAWRRRRPLPHPHGLHNTFLLFLVLVVAPPRPVFPSRAALSSRGPLLPWALRFSISSASLAQAEPPPHTLHTTAVQYTAPHLACYRTRNPNNLPNVSPVPNQPTNALPRRKHLSSLSPPCLFPPSRRAYPSTPPQHFQPHPLPPTHHPLGSLGFGALSTSVRCVSAPVCNPLNGPHNRHAVPALTRQWAWQCWVLRLAHLGTG